MVRLRSSFLQPRTDPRVVAIRTDPEIGGGSASVIDEAWTDQELIDAFEEFNLRTPRQAVQWAKRIHRIDLERWHEARREAF